MWREYEVRDGASKQHTINYEARVKLLRRYPQLGLLRPALGTLAQ